ncbi:MAG: ABC transporter permease [Candidatus Fermentibacter sp.]|nr:ABC transporter permease [Candidatus Fermentibacter sp.]
MNPGRVAAVARKEAVHILRDPRSMGMGLAMPLLLMILFGWALSLDVEEVPLGVLDQGRTPESRALVQAFDASAGFGLVRPLANYDDLSDAIDRREISSALVIDAGFTDSIAAGRSGRVQLILDGSDSRTAMAAMMYARSIASSFAVPGRTPAPPIVEVRTGNWYNSSRETRNAIIPGLSAVILMVVAAMLTSLTVAREWENGTMEQLAASPLRPGELILGKLLPYIALGMLDAAMTVGMATLVFGVPLRGNLMALAAVMLLFIVGAQAMGLAISIAARNQLLASQIAIVTSFLPSFLLSGFVYDISGMPVFIRLVSRLLPSRYIVAGLKAVFLKGGGFAMVAADAAALVAFTILMLAVARRRLRLRLD